MMDELDSKDDSEENEHNVIEPVLGEDEVMQQSTMNSLPEVEIPGDDDRPYKRGREEDEEEQWILVERDGKRLKGKFEVTVTSNDKLPKQFAMARLLTTNNISHIARIKYVSPYKVVLYFDDEKSADVLLTCKNLQELGWRCHTPMDVSVSYGIIRNVELDLNEKDMAEAITSPCELIAVKRLKRRNAEGSGWIESETVRLAFKGPTLPPCVKIHGMAIRVDAYVFPVTQCSRCWRYGHSLRACPATKQSCVKCTRNHENCEVTSFLCVNCRGNHHALDRICPAYRREKKIRETMAQHNCAYRKAAVMYVPPSITIEKDDFVPLNRQNPESQTTLHNLIPGRETYAETLKYPAAPVVCHEEAGTSAPAAPATNIHKRTIENLRAKKKDKRPRQVFEDVDMSDHSSEENPSTSFMRHSEEETKSRKNRRRSSGLTLKQLLDKLKAIIFSTEYEDIMAKLKHAVSIVMEWVTSSAVKYMCELPFKMNFS